MSADLTEFLLARIADDEAAARESGGGSEYGIFQPHEEDDIFMRRFSPARVLAECAAKRLLVAEHCDIDPCSHAYDTSLMGGLCETVRALAAVYADHPDYREEWRP